MKFGTIGPDWEPPDFWFWKDCNLGQNICSLFHFLAQFVFITTETELHYYHQKVNVRVASWVAERLTTLDPRKLGSFKKIPEMFGFNGEYPAVHPKLKVSRFLLKNCKISVAKNSIEKLILLNFVICLQPFVQDYASIATLS